jgi:hypothetical protein
MCSMVCEMQDGGSFANIYFCMLSIWYKINSIVLRLRDLQVTQNFQILLLRHLS